MESLLARYFDGDLSEGEARELLDAVERDTKLEKELRAYERVLAMGRALPSPGLPARFTERVMRSVAGEAKRGPLETRRLFFRTRWAGAALAAAVVIIAFVGGLWLGREGVPAPPGTRVATEGTGPSAVLPAAEATGPGVRYVRLVYVPREANVESVSVAGSFNDWDPASIPLQRQDGVWSTILILSAGSYEYMFVENGQRWVTDPLAARTRDDGFGTMNAVLDVEM